jgi:CheY-like chemotaxis protein
MQGAGQKQTEASDAAPRRILLVDDNRELRHVFRRMLVAAGYLVDEASNGAEARGLLASHAFDLVLSDVQMPDADGIELLKLAHEADPDLPVILVSGKPDLESALKAVEYGAREYLTKPVPREKVMTSVRRALDHRRERLREKEAVSIRSVARVRIDAESFSGALLGDRYRIGALLASGGMGAVYEAVREDLGEMPVAIKVLHPSIATDQDALRRFQREAQTVARLNHPNIVRVLDFQMPADEPAFLVMERLHGSSLGDAIRSGRRFSIEEVALVGSQALAALARAHAAEVIHRDLKPDNIYLASQPGGPDMVKVLDFGVAKLMGSQWNDKLTQTGMAVGTPAYMAPEQARGASVDARTDIYALGCLMFEALTGRSPYSADNYNALICEIQQGRSTRLATLMPELDPAFVGVVDKAMAREPADRFQTALSMADALSPWVRRHSEPLLQAPDSSPMSLAATLRPPSSLPPVRKAKRRKAPKA